MCKTQQAEGERKRERDQMYLMYQSVKKNVLPSPNNLTSTSLMNPLLFPSASLYFTLLCLSVTALEFDIVVHKCDLDVKL